MNKNQLSTIKQNSQLSYYFKKPYFLSQEDEENLVELIKENKITQFYDYSSKLIKNSTDVINLYVYLLSVLESKNISNEDIKNQTCWRLFKLSTIGWLQIHDKEIIDYCILNSTDSKLLEKLKKVTFPPWTKEYQSDFIPIEHQIQEGLGNLEESVLKYFDFLFSLKETNAIETKFYDKLLDQLRKEISLSKGGRVIGCLVSQELQTKLEFKVIFPKVALNKKDSQLQIS